MNGLIKAFYWRSYYKNMYYLYCAGLAVRLAGRATARDFRAAHLYPSSVT